MEEGGRRGEFQGPMSVEEELERWDIDIVGLKDGGGGCEPRSAGYV